MAPSPPPPDSNHVCLRRGYQCKCEQCLPWLERWSKELDAFAWVDAMIRDGKSIFERLTAQHPNTLQLHAQFFERQYIKHKMEQGALNDTLEEREPKRRTKIEPPPPPPSP